MAGPNLVSYQGATPTDPIRTSEITVSVSNPLPVSEAGEFSSLTNNITGNTTLKASTGFLGAIAVVVAGNTAGGVYNSGNVSGNLTGLQVGAIPNTLGAVSTYNFPMSNGIAIVPGTGQTVAVTWK